MEDPRTLHATNQLHWVNLIYKPPYTPWISAHFLNDGPSTVEIGINYPDRWFAIEPSENRNVEENISIIYYMCSPGVKATIKVMGEY